MRTKLTLLSPLAWLVSSADPRAQRTTSASDWTYHGGDAGSTKYAPLDQITAGNVASLRIAWRRPAVSPEFTTARPTLVVPRNFRATPLKADGGAGTAAHTLAAASLEVGWEHFDVVRELQETMHALELLLRAFDATEVGAADVADEHRVAGEDHRGFVAALGVCDQDRDHFGTMTGRVENF